MTRKPTQPAANLATATLKGARGGFVSAFLVGAAINILVLAGSLFTDDASPQYLHNPPRYWLYFDYFAHISHPADFGPYEDLMK